MSTSSPEDRMSTTIRRAALAACLAVVVAATVGAVLARPRTSATMIATRPQESETTADTHTTADPEVGFPFHPNVFAPTTVGAVGFMSWAYLDRSTGAITGSSNSDEIVNTHSMIKAWIASDYLRQLAERGAQPASWALSSLSQMIIESNNEIANQFFWGYLGAEDSVNRMIAICGLTDTIGTSNDWAETWMSARDSVRMGECIADGRGAGPLWTTWVLDRMREVRGDGDFGIRQAFAPEVRGTIAIKNGWWYEDGIYRVNCLAIGDTWVMAVLQRYDGYDFDAVAEVCTHVATALMVAPA